MQSLRQNVRVRGGAGPSSVRLAACGAALPTNTLNHTRATRRLTLLRRPTITMSMSVVFSLFLTAAWLAAAIMPWRLEAADTFSIATYNLENYLDAPSGRRPAKSDASKAKIREGLRKLNADILALQEVGSQDALQELRSSLRADGLDYRHWEFVNGSDTNIHVAVLSKFPILARRSHTNESFLLNGRRFRVSRGIAEVDVRVNPNYKLTLLAAHLKSRREVPEADQADLREHEAVILRRFIEERLEADPDINLAVLGDFNDIRNSRPIKMLIGRGTHSLIDTRPAERNGDDQPSPNPRLPPRNVVWTHYYAVEETYSRIDYILVSPGMAKEWDQAGSHVLAISNWGLASDHRPVVAGFFAKDL